MKKLYIFSILAVFPLLTACPVKNTPRQSHEGKREWQPAQTPVNESVEAKSFNAFDVPSAYAALSGGGSMMDKVLKPLADFVLNGKFIERAEFRTPRMTQMIQIFNTAFLMQLEAGDKSAEFLALKDRYYKTVFAGCSRDLKTDCFNADLFSADTRHTRIMTKMARALDPGIAAQITANETPKKCVENSEDCRLLVEDRYRLLAMGAYKRNRYDDSEYAFAYLKYARMFGQMLEFSQLRSSYLAETHAQIFDVLIAKYQPKDLKDGEFRAFVVNFNPWTYSNKSADMFQRGSSVMFGYATRCCLYKDEAKTLLSEAVLQAITEAQRDGDARGKSFRQMVLEIKAEHAYRLFDNLGISDIARQVEAMDPRFFNEVFFVVDRLYRGHLSTAEVEMVLSNANYARVQKELPKMVAAYLRIQLAFMVLETNRFMAKIYSSNISSDRIFQEAVVTSRELSNRWQAIQAQADLLDRMMGSYFKSRFASTEYYETNRLIKAINRNIYYMAGFPNMIVMNYFLSKLKGKVVISSWWGSFEIDADKILDAFFDGDIESPWFRFGKDPELLSRPMLLYSFEYLLSTEALDSFVAKDAANTANTASDRSKFLDLIFTKYLDDNLDDLRTKITAYGRETWGDARAVGMNEICNYETGQSRREPRPEINFMDLNRYTYSGLGDNGAHAVLSGLVSKSAGIIGSLREKTEYRMSMMLVMLDILEADLIRTKKITQAGQPHPDTARIRANISDLEDIRRQVARLFLDQHQHYHKCLLSVREVERRRANRLYEEERAHLGRIYDLMKPLGEIRDTTELNNKVAEINARSLSTRNLTSRSSPRPACTGPTRKSSRPTKASPPPSLSHRPVPPCGCNTPASSCRTDRAKRPRRSSMNPSPRCPTTCRPTSCAPPSPPRRKSTRKAWPCTTRCCSAIRKISMLCSGAARSDSPWGPTRRPSPRSSGPWPLLVIPGSRISTWATPTSPLAISTAPLPASPRRSNSLRPAPRAPSFPSPASTCVRAVTAKPSTLSSRWSTSSPTMPKPSFCWLKAIRSRAISKRRWPSTVR